MTWIRKQILDTNNPTGTSFGRLRTAGAGNRLDAEFLYDKNAHLFDELTNNGVVTFNGNPRDLTLSLSDGNNGSYSEMRSHPVPYTPAYGQFIAITGVLDFAAIGTGTAEVFLRSNITGTVQDLNVITENDGGWNSDATANIDWGLSQIVEIDFQSLKVGTIRFNLNRKGVSVPFARIDNDNVRNSGYWQNPSLPAYWKIYTTGGETMMEMGYGDDNNAVGIRYVIAANASATMKAGCVTVKSEGGSSLLDMVGFPMSGNNSATAVSVGATLIPVYSIQPAATFKTLPNLKIGIPRNFTISATNPIRVEVIVGGTLTAPSWTAIGSDSMMNQDVAATAITGGRTIFSDYVPTTSNNRANSRGGLLGKAVLWNRLGSETGILSICAAQDGASAADCKVSLNWDEI